jgi:hypothetical protein
MNTNRISADLQNDIMRVLRGETKVEIPLPDAILDAARNAAVQLKQLSLTEGYLSAESKKQILRKNLNEGLEKCGCSPTTDMVVRYEEEAMKPVVSEDQVKEAKKSSVATAGVPAGAGEDKFKAARELIKKAGHKAKLGKGVPAGESVEIEGANAFADSNAEKLEENSDMMLRSWIRNNYPKADNAKFNKIYAAMKKQHSKDPQGYTRGGGFSKVAKDAKIKEQFESDSLVAEELKNFVANLSEEDLAVLRTLINEQN